MFYFIAQLLDLLLHHRFHMFLVLFLYAWTVFAIRLYYARKYTPYIEPYSASVSVIIPIYNEDAETLTRCINSLMTNEKYISEIICAVDHRDTRSYMFLQEYKRKFGVNKLKILLINEIGKRAAVAQAMKAASGEIVVLVDSDTTMAGSDTIYELIKPFRDPLVGGVTSNQRIRPPLNSLKKRLSDWMEHMRCLLSFPAMSVNGVVGCLPGRCIAFRREILLPYLDNEFLNEKFLGVRCETGDDRCLTNIVLKHGYKTVYQSTAKVYTEVPETWGKFIKQQLRWLRSSRRETLMNMKWMIRKHFILPLSFISDIVIPLLFLAALIEATLNALLHYNPILFLKGTIFENILCGSAIGVAGAITSTGIRQTPHLRKHIHDIAILPLFVAFGALLSLMTIYALATLKDQSWMTR